MSPSNHTIDLMLTINSYKDSKLDYQQIERWVGVNIKDERKQEIAEKIKELRDLLKVKELNDKRH